MSKTVAFDPGIGQFVIDFNNYINDVYSQLMSLNSLSQKRTRFRLFNNKIYSGMENNIAFFQGCLLWAYYIKKKNEAEPLNIEGNEFLNLTPEQVEEYDFLMQVNFMENYFDSYERDTQYYTGKKIAIPEQWKKILELYKEFLELNKGFVNTKTTEDVVLPETLQKQTFNKDIKKIISKSIKEENLQILLDIKII